MMATLGIRNNNPLNIRYSPCNKWQGQTGCNKGFCTFDTIEYGIRAALVLLRNYVRRGLCTPRLIISNWAPSNENDTESYINNCLYPWHPDHRLSTIEDISILCSAMAYYESRYEISPSDVISIASKFNIKM